MRMFQSISPNMLADDLNRDGIAIVPHFMEPGTCDHIRTKVEALLKRTDVEQIDEVVGYSELSRSGRTVINIRGAGGRDQGMIDIFNVDAEVRELTKFKNNANILDGINAQAKKQVTPTNVNAYINAGVTNTRGFHSDSDSEQYKSFIYLTDVCDLHSGPFTYVRGSHTSSLISVLFRRGVNKLRGKPPTDAVWVSEDRVIHCLAEKGTLIVANQRGMHRGWPQSEHASRMLVTVSFKPLGLQDL